MVLATAFIHDCQFYENSQVLKRENFPQTEKLSTEAFPYFTEIPIPQLYAQLLTSNALRVTDSARNINRDCTVGISVLILKTASPPISFQMH